MGLGRWWPSYTTCRHAQPSRVHDTASITEAGVAFFPDFHVPISLPQDSSRVPSRACCRQTVWYKNDRRVLGL